MLQQVLADMQDIKVSVGALELKISQLPTTQVVNERGESFAIQNETLTSKHDKQPEVLHSPGRTVIDMWWKEDFVTLLTLLEIL